MKVVLGIDTSCYTTSLAMVSLEGALLGDSRSLLPVTKGKIGLRQQEAVFCHLNNLPQLMKALYEDTPNLTIVAVSCSNQPRPINESYLPVFTVGWRFADFMAQANRIPLYLTSHQQGHAMAAWWSANTKPQGQAFLFVHLSGGTTEILHMRKTNVSFDGECIGQSLDLHAGQLIDRIGVHLGLPFPAGPALELLAERSNPQDGIIKIPSSIESASCHFSGAETNAKQWVEKGASHEAVAYAVFDCIGRTIAKCLIHAMRQTLIDDVLIAGGVAANRIVQHVIKERLIKNNLNARVHVAEKNYCSDNAVGVALLGMESYLQGV